MLLSCASLHKSVCRVLRGKHNCGGHTSVIVGRRGVQTSVPWVLWAHSVCKHHFPSPRSGPDRLTPPTRGFIHLTRALAIRFLIPRDRVELSSSPKISAYPLWISDLISYLDTDKLHRIISSILRKLELTKYFSSSLAMLAYFSRI